MNLTAAAQRSPTAPLIAGTGAVATPPPYRNFMTPMRNLRSLSSFHALIRCRLAIALLLALAFEPALHAGTLATFRTSVGEIDVELFDQDKPITVQNFIRYVQSGVYSNMFFHRCVPGFVVQGGGFFVTNRTTTPNIVAVPELAPITNEFNVGPRVSNTYGTIAMALTGTNANSATAEWFFNLADNSANLDKQNGGFAVFGRVVGGTNVLNRFNNLSSANGIINVNLGSPLDTLPILYHGQTNATFNDLVYVDISLLQVQAQLDASGSREISWNSVSNRLHTVEFATNLPPVWTPLVSATGTGSTMHVHDTNAAPRFYRVRVDFSPPN
jgi:cyclophilin family peptidyl-prolyl cis-trans isomerase